MAGSPNMCATIPQIHFQNFLISPNGNSILIRHYLSTPCPTPAPTVPASHSAPGPQGRRGLGLREGRWEPEVTELPRQG